MSTPQNVPQNLPSKQEYDAVDAAFSATARDITTHLRGCANAAARVDFMDRLVLALTPLLPCDQLARITVVRAELAAALSEVVA